MTAATILRHIQTADPAYEVVVLTVSSAETYVSRKFPVVLACSAHMNDTGTAAVATFATNVVTITATGVTDKTCTLEIWGHGK